MTVVGKTLVVQAICLLVLSCTTVAQETAQIDDLVRAFRSIEQAHQNVESRYERHVEQPNFVCDPVTAIVGDSVQNSLCEMKWGVEQESEYSFQWMCFWSSSEYTLRAGNSTSHLNPELLPNNMSLVAEAEAVLPAVSYMPSGMPVLFGLNTAGESLAGLIETNRTQAKLSVAGERHLAKFESGGTTYSIWFEGAPHYRPYKISILKARGAKFLELTNPKSRIGFDDLATVIWAKEKIGPLRYLSDNPFVIERMPYSMETMVEGGNRSKIGEESVLVSRESVAKGKIDRVAFERLEIPEGSQVDVVGQRGIRFELREGQVVKVVDGKTVVLSNGVRYRSEGWGNSIYFTLLVLLLIGVSFVLIKRRIG